MERVGNTLVASVGKLWRGMAVVTTHDSAKHLQNCQLKLMLVRLNEQAAMILVNSICFWKIEEGNVTCAGQQNSKYHIRCSPPTPVCCG